MSTSGPGPLTPLPSPPHPNRATQLPSTPSSLSGKREDEHAMEEEIQIDETQSAHGDGDGEGLGEGGAGEREEESRDAAMVEVDEDVRPIRKTNLKTKIAARSTRSANSASLDDWSKASSTASARASGRRTGPASSKSGEKLNFNSEGVQERILDKDYWQPGVDLFMEQEDMYKARALAAANSATSS